MLKNNILKTVAVIISVMMLTSSALPVFATDDLQGDSANKENDNVIIITTENADKITNDETPKVEEPVIKKEDITLKYKDLKGHWASETFSKAYDDGIIKGFEDSTMRPDSIITPAQMVTVITRMLKSGLSTSVEEYGIKEDCWYKDALSNALALGFIEKSDIANMDKKMSRKDSVVMMSKAFQLSDADPDFTDSLKYSDFSELSLNEKVIYATMINNKYIQGWDGKLQLDSGITRAEFITILYRLISKSVDLNSISNLQTITSSTLATGNKLVSSGANINNNLWLGGDVSEIEITNSLVDKLFVMSDSISSISLNNVIIDKLLLASKNGNLDIDCYGIKTVSVGDGNGVITLESKGNNIDVIGNHRTVLLNGASRKIAISGNKNTIVLSSDASSDNMVIYGDNNIVTVDSNISNLTIKGKNNTIAGNGTVENLTMYNSTSKIDVKVNNKINNTDKGIEGMTATISVPGTIKTGNYLNATLNLNNTPTEKKYSKITWYVDGKAVTTNSMDIPSEKYPSLYYYVDYSSNVADSLKISCKVEYTTEDGKSQSTQSSTATVKIEKPVVVKAATVETQYKGNYTTQWAISHNLSNADKENFVNSKGYSSSSKYLIWVNIGTQYTSVFTGSKGNWKLVRSGLVSTGANDCTPRGVFKTTYKQTNWTTESYTVKPIVRFYGQGYAMHSRLYKPGTTELKSGDNGVGYPLSHGCVRMQADDIQWIYDNIPNGTTIVVY